MGSLAPSGARSVSFDQGAFEQPPHSAQLAIGRAISSGGGQQQPAAIKRAVGAVTCDQRSHQQLLDQGGSWTSSAPTVGAKGHVGRGRYRLLCQ